MNKHFKGFTILETLISLILISIIIGLTYSIFNLIGKQMALLEEEYTQVLQYNLFNTTIKNDIKKSTNYKINNDQLILINYNEANINYSIKNNRILRQNNIKTDTFNINLISYRFFKKNQSDNYEKTFQVSLLLLNDTINANYFLNKSISEVINTMYFNED